MGIITKSNQATSSSGAQSIIAKGNKFQGELNLKDDLHIDGNFEGNIFSESNLSIGSAGTVFGFVEANKILISGNFRGQVRCEVLEILSGGVFNGDVLAQELRIESGSKFFGHSHNEEEETFPQSLPASLTKKLESSLYDSQEGDVTIVDQS